MLNRLEAMKKETGDHNPQYAEHKFESQEILKTRKREVDVHLYMLVYSFEIQHHSTFVCWKRRTNWSFFSEI